MRIGPCASMCMDYLAVHGGWNGCALGGHCVRDGNGPLRRVQSKLEGPDVESGFGVIT